MRIVVRKHYKELAKFVGLANLAWDEIIRRDEFPTLNRIKPHDKHRDLLKRIGRQVAARFSSIELPSDVPPLYFPGWNQCPAPQWRQLHAFALVRRVFDSLQFLVGGTGIPTVGGTSVAVMLQVNRANGTTLRVRDPYENFLAALTGRDLARVRFCAYCRSLLSRSGPIRIHAVINAQTGFASKSLERNTPNMRKTARSENAPVWYRSEREDIEQWRFMRR